MAVFGTSSIAFVVGWSPRCFHRIQKSADPKTFNYFYGSTRCASYRFGSMRTFRSERTVNSAEVNAINFADALCGDDLSVRAMSSFGGIQYFNTDVDNRFRILFVLGGPGELYRFFQIELMLDYSFSYFVFFRFGKGNAKRFDGTKLSSGAFFCGGIATQCTS
jgi:hypothetical protein